MLSKEGAQKNRLARLWILGPLVKTRKVPRKLNKSKDFQIFGMYYVEEFSEKSVKYRQMLMNFQLESVRKLQKFSYFNLTWRFVKKSPNFATKIC